MMEGTIPEPGVILIRIRILLLGLELELELLEETWLRLIGAVRMIIGIGDGAGDPSRLILIQAMKEDDRDGRRDAVLLVPAGVKS